MQLTCETFTSLDADIKMDFQACYQEALDEIEQNLESLNEHCDQANIHALFRSVHSLKGNCGMVFLDPAVELLHELEELVSDLRDQEIGYEVAWGDFILEVATQLQQLLANLARDGYADLHEFTVIQDTVIRLNELQPAQRTQHLSQAVTELTDKTGMAKESDVPAESQAVPKSAGDDSGSENRQSDLDFFQSVATQLDAITWFRRGRSRQELKLSMLLNERIGSPIPDDQLYAAVCLHDLGMALIPQNLLNKQTSLSDEELAQLRQHPLIGSGLLSRMHGWEMAADIVASHHEWYDGGGYPQGLKGEDIPVGARIIAIIDAFAATTGDRADRNVKKGVLSAAREINNGAGTQFDPDMADAFTDILRHLFVKRASE